MENQPNNLNQTLQPTDKHLSPARKGILVFGVVIIVVLLAFYVYATYLSRLNYNKVAEEAQKAQTASTQLVYRNDLFGFSIDLPDSWKGYTVNHIKEDIRDLTGRTKTNNGVVDSFQIIELHHPQETAENPREDMPIMIFTLTQWMHIHNEEWSVGAAPMPPTLLGQNSQWVIALPARYNYDYKPGWEEVDQLVHTLKVFEPGTNSQETSNNNQINLDISAWKTYTNTEYGFEFKYPDGWVAEREEPTPVQRFNYTTDDGYLSVSIHIVPGTKCASQYYINNPEKLNVGKDKYGNLMLPTSMYDKDLYLLCIDTPDTMFSLSGWGEGNAVDKNLFRQILSTFKFTEGSM